ELVAMRDQIAPPVGAIMHEVPDDLDAAKMRPVEVAQHLVVIARHIDDARALARLAQELLYDVIVRLRPVPSAAQGPAVDDVADEKNRLGIIFAQEVEEAF